MGQTLYEDYFINPAFESGIRAYLSYKEGNPFNRNHTYEMYVIKALTIIYGEKSIILPYKIDNEKALQCNLLMYDLKEKDMLNFIKYFGEYHSFMRHFNSDTKASGLINEIEKILIEMVNKRGKKHPYTEEELAEFDKIFNPMSGDLKKLKSLVASNHGLIIKTWQYNKYELSNTQVRMMAINPNLLEPKLYEKCGFDITRVALLPEYDIIKINEEITKEEQNKTLVFPKMQQVRKQIIITSGSGFVDKLMLLSIVATEIMIGIVIAVNLGG